MIDAILELFCQVIESLSYVDVSKASQRAKRNFVIISGIFTIIALCIRIFLL